MEGDDGPHCFHNSEGPRALQEAVYRPKRAGGGEGQYEPGAAIFESVEDQHGGDGDEAEQSKRVHVSAPSWKVRWGRSGAVGITGIITRNLHLRRPHARER